MWLLCVAPQTHKFGKVQSTYVIKVGFQCTLVHLSLHLRESMDWTIRKQQLCMRARSTLRFCVEEPRDFSSRVCFENILRFAGFCQPRQLFSSVSRQNFVGLYWRYCDLDCFWIRVQLIYACAGKINGEPSPYWCTGTPELRFIFLDTIKR